MWRFILLLFLPLTLWAKQETVVVIHGLAATSGTMWHIQNTLESEGYRVINLDYPSMSQPLDKLAEQLRAEIKNQTADAEIVHFVTHSMGGILLRIMQKNEPFENIGRVVMIATPNQGSLAVNLFGDTPGVPMLIGPAGMALASGDNEQLSKLGPATFELGVIAGSRGVDPWLSSVIPGPDDGIVSVESAKLEGMADFTVVHESHPMLVFNAEVMDQMLHFLSTGTFVPDDGQPEPDTRWTRNWTHRATPRAPR